MPTPAELLSRANKPLEESLRLHPFYRGKVQLMPKCPIRGPEDWSIWYTPGVAAPCRAIVKQPEQVYEHTNKGNVIAIVSDGTRVLGLGDIGPEAGLPVMEGKALLFKHLGGVDAVPLCIRAADENAIVAVVRALEPSFGGINLEDVAQPKCFHVLERLRAELRNGGIRTQAMLAPEPLELNPARAAQIQAALPELRAMGFEVEPFGATTLLLKGTPAVFGAISGAKLLSDMIESIGDAGVRHGEAAFEEGLKQLACHGSIRVGRALEPGEIHALLADLDRTEFKTNCPHGRPVHIQFARGQIERMFRR